MGETKMRTSSVVIFCLVLTVVVGNGAAAQPSEPPAVQPLPVPRGFLNVLDCGATGDGVTKDTASIQTAVDRAAEAGGGVVYFPPGTYLSGAIQMKSNVTLHLEVGATLLGSTSIDDYPCVDPAFRSYTDKYVCQSLITGEGLHHIAITGQGTIDGQGAAFDSKVPGGGYRKRPYLIRFVSCSHVLVEGVTLRNSPMWMQHYLNCENVVLRGLDVYNHSNANNDMVDIDCSRNVRISDCFATTGDDAITLKSTADVPCENVSITNCTVSSNCNAIKMGTESNGGFKNISVSNCTISKPKNGYAGDRSLSGIALMIVDGGLMEGITISNIAMEGVRSAIFIRLGNRARPFKADMEKPGIGTLRDVNISNIVARNVEKTGCFIAGLPDHPVQNVSISNARITFAGGGALEDAAREIPENAEKYPEGTMFGTLPAYGFYCRHVDGVTFRNVEVGFASPDLRPALVCDDVQHLVADGFQGQSVAEGSPLLVLKNVQGALIRGSVAPEGCAAFLHVEKGCERVTLLANDLSGAKIASTFAEGVEKELLHQDSNRLP